MQACAICYDSTMLDKFAHGGTHAPGTEHPESDVALPSANPIEIANSSDDSSLIFMGVFIAVIVIAVITLLVFSKRKRD